jgi:hypothetical protein
MAEKNVRSTLKSTVHCPLHAEGMNQKGRSLNKYALFTFHCTPQAEQEPKESIGRSLQTEQGTQTVTVHFRRSLIPHPSEPIG